MTTHLNRVRAWRQGRGGLAGVAALLVSSMAGASTITVSTALDLSALDGLCSLREALQSASSNSAPEVPAGECAPGTAAMDTIAFAIPGPGPHTIQLTAHLPWLSSNLTIDGFTQAGATPNTRVALDQHDAHWQVRLQGRSNPLPPLQAGLLGSQVSNVSILGLEFTGFSHVPGVGSEFPIAFFDSQQLRIAGNWMHHNSATAATVQGCSNVVFGGLEAGDRNLIHDQIGSGINGWLGVTTRDALVTGNVIGVRFVDGQPQPGPIGGSAIYGPGLSQSTIEGNWVANANRGIQLQNSGSQAVQVENNLIGGLPGYGNDFGILIASGVGPGAPMDHRIVANQITHNDIGVQIQNAQPGMGLRAIRLNGNRIHANGGMEIDLGPDGGNFGDGPTANDPGDADQGPNGRQNHPVIGAIGWNVAHGQWSMDYALDAPPGSYELEVVFGTRCDAGGFGVDGVVHPRSVTASVQSLVGSIASSYPEGIYARGYISATATGPDGTSEYSACARYLAPSDLFMDGFE